MTRGRIFFTFLYLAVANSLYSKETLALQTLHIGALVPFDVTNERDKRMTADLILPMVEIALEDIERKALLPGYQLQLHVNDTQCRTDHASRALFELIHKKPTKIALIGAACSEVSERIAEEAKTWNLLMVSYGSTSPILQNREKYPLFYRTIPSDAACNKGLISLLKKFKWRQVGIIGKTDISHSQTTANLREELEKSDINILTSETFTDDPTAQVKSLKEKDVRIIIGNFDEKSARRVFCQAYQVSLYGSRYAWILPGWYRNKWWKSELIEDSLSCTESEMNEAVRGYIACDSLRMSPAKGITVSGQTPEKLNHLYQEKNTEKKSLKNTDAGFAYDAVWTIAVALNRTEQYFRSINSDHSIGNFNYADSQTVEHLITAIQQTKFTGVTGPVEFERNGDRRGFMKIEQLQGEEEQTVLFYLSQNDSLIAVKGSEFYWQGSGPPSDQAKLILELMTISPILYGVMCTITILCIILAVCFLAFNIRLRHYRYIQMSSPRLNDTIIVGCIAMYLSVFLFGLDGKLLSSSQYSVNCQARIWLASLGFTTAFGAMFAKTWRVYVIFTNAKLRKKVIEDGRLFLFVGALLLVDVFTLSLWTALDTQTRTLYNGTMERGTEFDTIPQWEYCDCRHKNIWFGVLFASKGLLLLFGVFLAWETRHVKIAALNDSRHVGLSVYNVVILSVVGVPTAFMIGHAHNVTFSLTAAFILFCTTVTLCLVFVPKFIAVKRDPSVLNTSGATSTTASQGSGESCTSHDKGIKGAKYIALAAENSNLKNLIAEKEEQIGSLEVRLRTSGVPVECIRRLSLAMASKRTREGKHASSPTLNVRGDRDSGGSIHIDVKDDGAVCTGEKKTVDKVPVPSSPRQSNSSSQFNIDENIFPGNVLAKAASTHKTNQFSLIPRMHDGVPQIQQNEPQEAHYNAGIFMETSNSPTTEISKVNTTEIPFYKDPPKGDTCSSVSSIKARYGKPKRETSSEKEKTADSNSNVSPAIKEIKRKGSTVLVSKSRSGETCFQVKTPADLKRSSHTEEITV
ncbi:gamma-aminobutyric acid type B receptor subunit 2-like [Acropora millepora]|uniref:gamma-aminobutyric acid type B receptor subunit 2-like n=1 Tax=Acropora millepora TaxID=45264 RepID=UPI001CF5361D|nr:gamma-aminobutyric acid type B receptor subunit 2-like [Acropora millepora]